MLGDIIEKTVARGGSVIIPTFAVGRAQSILYHLWRLKQSGRLGFTPVYLDSPMAIDATDLLHAHREDHRLGDEDCNGACHIATYVRDVEESKALTANPLPKVILAGSGMATSGRVLHHLATYGPDRRNTILLSGFQAAGTRGRSLVEGAKELKIHGQWVPIAAEVRELDMLSAHADAGEILRWLSGFRRKPRSVFIVHGEPHAADALRVRISDSGLSAPIPEATHPDIEAKLAGLEKPRGWGLFIIRHMVDEMNILNEPESHTIELIFYREKAGDEHKND